MASPRTCAKEVSSSRFWKGIRTREYCRNIFARWKWSPSSKAGGWERFAEEQRQERGPGGEGDVLYTRIAWAMSVHWRIARQVASAATRL